MLMDDEQMIRIMDMDAVYLKLFDTAKTWKNVEKLILAETGAWLWQGYFCFSG